MQVSSQRHNLQFLKFDDPNLSMGLAVRLMMDKPAYRNLGFAEWVGILNGQILRGHYGFVVKSSGDGRQVVGFVGWALTSESKAQAWATRNAVLQYADCLDGDAVIFNVWIANDRMVHRFMVDMTRRLIVDRKYLYWKRMYGDGNSRIVKLGVNQFVPAHVARQIKIE